MGAEPGVTSLAEQAREYLKVKYRKPGNVYLGVVSRIDAFVSGVVVLARTSKAASRLSEQFRKSSVRKNYYAIVSGDPSRSSQRSEKPGSYRLESYLRKNDRLKRVESFRNPVAGAKQAILEFEVMDSQQGYSLLDIDLQTGRKHQIRAQFAELGCPIYGDRKYDSPENMGRQIALHAYQLQIRHPTRQENMIFASPIPEIWHKYPGISRLLSRF